MRSTVDYDSCVRPGGDIFLDLLSEDFRSLRLNPLTVNSHLTPCEAGWLAIGSSANSRSTAIGCEA